MKTSLIIGGNSGLGLSLAQKLAGEYRVVVTGRKDPALPNIEFRHLDLAESNQLPSSINQLLSEVGKVHSLIYAAGFFQAGTITELTAKQVADMLNVGLVAPLQLVKSLLDEQSHLDQFVAITSTSQWTPRLKEPVYTAVKAGLGAFANSLSLDSRVEQTLVAGPAGMKTNFWKDTDEDTSEMLEPDWVAGQVIDLLRDNYSYRFAKILRQPARVEVIETRA